MQEMTIVSMNLKMHMRVKNGRYVKGIVLWEELGQQDIIRRQKNIEHGLEVKRLHKQMQLVPYQMEQYVMMKKFLMALV